MIEFFTPIAIVIFASLAFLALDRQMKRFDEERAAWEKERRELLDRIQAPEVALYRAHANGVAPEVAPVGDGPWVGDVPKDFDSRVH